MGVRKWGGRWYVSKQWPDGSRLRKPVPSASVGKKLMIRVEEAILMGRWEELRDELRGVKPYDPTIEELSEKYMTEYVEPKNRDPQTKAWLFGVMNPLIGHIKVTRFSRSDAYRLIEKCRKEGLKAATINRRLALLSNLLTYAVEREIISEHPMNRFRRLPEPQKALRLLTLEEERALVDAVASIEPSVGAYVALLGETALRKAEGLRLKWQNVSLSQKLLTVAQSKSGKVRHVPLSDHAIEWLRTLTRIVGQPYVFLQRNGQRWRDPRRPFHQGREKAGLDWVGFHDLRHFRASQWVMHGVDLRTVQELLGHSSIQTTMRYAHLAPNHTRDAVRRVGKLENETVTGAILERAE